MAQQTFNNNQKQKQMKMFIGLMGVSNNGTLVTPSGKNLFRLPLRLASFIQRVHHKIARTTH